jgi:transposase
MLLVDGKGLPLAINVHSASPAEVTLIEPLLDRHILGEHSIRLVYDRAADSDSLRERLAAEGIELICPHRKNRKRPPIQDGRSLKRYRKRWTIERTMAWLQSYRRLVVRYEHDPKRFLAFAELACLHKTLKRLKPL